MASIELPLQHQPAPSATSTLHALLIASTLRFPKIFATLQLPVHPRATSVRGWTELLTQFEVIRTSSDRRLEVAEFVTEWVQQQFAARSNDHRMSLEQSFMRDVEALPVEDVSSRMRAGRSIVADESSARVPHDLSDALTNLERHSLLSEEAVTALKWALSHRRSGGQPPPADLAGQRFVLMGGTAELAPTALLLAAGADVLTTHTSHASLQRAASADPQKTDSPGRLFAVPGGSDLLASPAQFAQSAIAFAAGKRVHVGAFAYRGGEGREWRLTAVMDAIIRKLRRAGAVASVTYYLSPSIITEVSTRTARESAERLAKEQTPLTRVIRTLSRRMLFEPNLITSAGRSWARSSVPRQGISYQAGNLFGKNYPAEILVASSLSQASDGIRVSANVAPITRTRSTEIPAAKLAFAGLGSMGIVVFEPWLARRLMFLLMTADLFGPGPRGEVPFPQQVHGGVFTNAWALSSALQLAYAKARARRLLLQAAAFAVAVLASCLNPALA